MDCTWSRIQIQSIQTACHGRQRTVNDVIILKLDWIQSLLQFLLDQMGLNERNRRIGTFNDRQSKSKVT